MSAKRPSADQQLPLPGIHTPSLRDESASLEQTVQWMRAKISALQDELTHTRDQRDSATEAYEQAIHHCAALRQERDRYQREAGAWKTFIERMGLHLHSNETAPALWIAKQLTQLLAVAHPDKWNQGQPAAMVAHEVTVAINALRQQVQEGHAPGEVV
jgi:hypothetical protein